MPSALYFLKSIFVWGNHLPRVVMMCDEKKYNPQGGSLLACVIIQGRQRCTCQPCAIESITPMGNNTGAIECTIRWDMDTSRGLVEFGRGSACVPARVALQGRIHRSIPHVQCVIHKTYFPYGNAAARTFGRARRHRPYGFVWADYAWDA